MSAQRLRQELNAILMHIRIQKKAVIETAVDLGCDVYLLRDQHGTFVFLPLLAAEAHAIAALAFLEKPK